MGDDRPGSNQFQIVARTAFQQSRFLKWPKDHRTGVSFRRTPHEVRQKSFAGLLEPTYLGFLFDKPFASEQSHFVF